MQAVFLDKDGTLVENVPYNVDPALVLLTAGAGPALRLLRQQGYALFVVSNQGGVARGLFSERDLEPAWRRLQELVREEGVALDGFVYCPHDPRGKPGHYAVSCSCRKPMPGMLLRLARQHGIDLSASWMIGDILDDVEAGRRAGCRTVLIDNGNETEWKSGPMRTPDLVASDLLRAARGIHARQTLTAKAYR
ncbi:MAG: D-glycero-alpha-D-manno-heptose-1,7-bisphosphate 7-phosphatase [Noviherbaspirillum sp.]